jgi:hypothetical protein
MDYYLDLWWYKYTTFRNSGGGDVSRWTNLYDKTACRGLVRREDGFVFLNSLSCRDATDCELEQAVINKRCASARP